MRRKVLLALLALSLLHPASAPAQSVVRVEVGTSSTADAYGARAEWYHRRFDGWVGLLGFHEPALGGQVHTRWRGLDATLGDLWLANALPSDRFGGGWSVLGRGLAVADSLGAFGWTGFGGVAAQPLSLVPGFVTAAGSEPLGFAELRWRPGPTLRAGLRETLTEDGWSHLQFGSWSRGSLRVDGTSGLLQGDPYGALALTLSTPSLEIDASWTEPASSGRRIAWEELRSSELTGINARLAWRPAERWRLGAGRVQRRPSSFLPDTTPVRTIWDASLALPLGEGYSAYLGAHASPGLDDGGDSYGLNATLNAAPRRGLRGSASLFASRGPTGETSSLATLSAYERIRPELEILQRLQYDGRSAPSLSFGGAFVRGSTRIGVDYRTEFVPSPGGSQFRTALVLDVRLALSTTSDLSVGTYLDSSGRASYRVQSGRWFYPAGPARPRGVGFRADDYVFQDHVVRGRVLLDDGTPVEGAAVRIGERTVYTDAQGRFLLRTQGRETLTLEVNPAEFLLETLFQVRSAPARVTSLPEADAEEVVIVLERMLRNQAQRR